MTTAIFGALWIYCYFSPRHQHWAGQSSSCAMQLRIQIRFHPFWFCQDRNLQHTFSERRRSYYFLSTWMMSLAMSHVLFISSPHFEDHQPLLARVFEHCSPSPFWSTDEPLSAVKHDLCHNRQKTYAFVNGSRATTQVASCECFVDLQIRSKFKPCADHIQME